VSISSTELPLLLYVRSVIWRRKNYQQAPLTTAPFAEFRLHPVQPSGPDAARAALGLPAHL